MRRDVLGHRPVTRPDGAALRRPSEHRRDHGCGGHDPRARPARLDQDVASACGLHRATVHRHFASREDLVLAVRDHVFARAAAERDRIFAERHDPVAALEAYVIAMLDLSDRYRLHRFVTVIDAHDEVARRASSARVAEVLRRAQDRGAVRVDIEAGELAVALSGLISTIGPEIATGAMTSAQGAALCTRLMLR